jgi:transporter family-2 protein
MKMLTDPVLVALALAAGALLPLQALVNARLGVQLAAPVWAATVQNVLGALAMGLVVLAVREPAPSAAQFAAAPVWTWAGGLLGATYVLIALLATPKLGATRAMVAIITGQLAASVLFDQFGVLQARRDIDLKTVGGLVLLAGGAWLILRRS